MAHLVRISSIVLFFKRDCDGGTGPVVDAARVEVPRPVPVFAAKPLVCVVPGAVLVVAGWVLAELGAPSPNSPPDGAAVDVAAAPEEADVVLAGVAPNRGVDVLWAVVDVGVAPKIGPDVVVEEPPRLPKRDFCAGAVVELGAVDVALACDAGGKLNAGLADADDAEVACGFPNRFDGAEGADEVLGLNRLPEG